MGGVVLLFCCICSFVLDLIRLLDPGILLLLQSTVVKLNILQQKNLSSLSICFGKSVLFMYKHWQL